MKLFKLCALSFFILISSTKIILAKEPSFSFESISSLIPETKFDSKNNKFLKVELLEKDGEKEIYVFRYYPEKYFLTTYVQVEKGEIIDVYLRFPNNFSHDRLLEVLQKEFGKHDKVFRIPSNALFTWNNEKLNNRDLEILYHGSCTFTCFPMGLYLTSKKSRGNPSFISLYQKFNKDFPKDASQ